MKISLENKPEAGAAEKYQEPEPLEKKSGARADKFSGHPALDFPSKN